MKSLKPTKEQTDPLKLIKEGVYQVIIGAIREEARLACTKEQVVESLRQSVESGELVKVWINGKYQYFTPEDAEQVVEDLGHLVESGEGSRAWVNSPASIASANSSGRRITGTRTPQSRNGLLKFLFGYLSHLVSLLATFSSKSSLAGFTLPSATESGVAQM